MEDVKDSQAMHDTKSQSISSSSSPNNLEANNHGEAKSDFRNSPEFAEIDEKKLMRKVDFRLIPWLAVLYLLSFLDRSAIGNAKLYGLGDTIGANPSQLNIAISMFFITYAVFEIPSNVLLKRFRPRVWFTIITTLVGVAMLSQGVVSSYGGLVATRVVLGIVEAGLFPGAMYLLSSFYKRKEYGLRAAIFFSAATISGAFGGLLSAAIHNMNGIGGYEGWRWIFIIIGLATFLSGVASYWLVSDFPETASYLNETERKFLIARLNEDQKYSAAGEVFQWRNLWQCFLDWKTWVAAIAYMGCDGALYSFSLFTPTIVQALGYTATRANLVSVPIYVVACIFTVIVGFTADRKGHRAFINIALSAVGVVGYVVLIASRNAGVSYAFIYLAALGIYPCIANTIALTSTGVEGTYKRAAVMGFVISFGNINGAATTNFYRAEYKPWYSVSHGLVLMYILLGMIATLTFLFGIRYENRRRERGDCDETILTSKNSSPQEIEAAIVEAARIRKEEQDALKSKGGLKNKIKALYYSVDMRSGGTYATIDEAKNLKGDYYSKFRYSE